MQGIDLAISLVGGQVRLAESLGVRQQTVSYWRKAGVPVEHCAAIERLTGGRVTRRDLRPEDWARIWPELAAPAGPTPHRRGSCHQGDLK